MMMLSAKTATTRIQRHVFRSTASESVLRRMDVRSMTVAASPREQWQWKTPNPQTRSISARRASSWTASASALPSQTETKNVRRLSSGSSNSSSSNRFVSETEVHKFSQFSQTWWDPKQNPLIGMNPIRVQYIVDHLASHGAHSGGSADATPLKDLRALDIGCGGGLLSESLARLGAHVTSIDPSEALVEAARQHAQLDAATSSIDYRGGWTAERLAQQDDLPKFDVVCMLEVIEHVPDPQSILTAASSLLKPDGTLFLSTVNRTLKSRAVAIVGAEYIMRYLPVGTHDWNQFKSPQEIQQLMRSVGLREAHVAGMVLKSPPVFGNWDWALDDGDTDINWIGAYGKDQPK